MISVDGTKEMMNRWNERLDVEFIGSSYPTTLIVKSDFEDRSCGKELLFRIGHFSRYMNVTYVNGLNGYSYIIQYDFDLYHNDNLDKLFSYIYSFILELSSEQKTA